MASLEGKQFSSIILSQCIWNLVWLEGLPFGGSSLIRGHYCTTSFMIGLVWFMVFDATSLSWRSVLLVEETEVPGEKTNLLQVIDKLYHILLHRVHVAWAGFELTTLVVIGTDCTCSWKSNYHTMTTTTTTGPLFFGREDITFINYIEDLNTFGSLPALSMREIIVTMCSSFMVFNTSGLSIKTQCSTSNTPKKHVYFFKF